MSKKYKYKGEDISEEFVTEGFEQSNFTTLDEYISSTDDLQFIEEDEEENKENFQNGVTGEDAPVVPVNLSRASIIAGVQPEATESASVDTSLESEDPEPKKSIRGQVRARELAARKKVIEQKNQEELIAAGVKAEEYNEALLGIDKTLTDAGSSIWSYNPNNISDLYLKTTGEPLEFDAIQSTSFIGGSSVSYGGVFKPYNSILTGQFSYNDFANKEKINGISISELQRADQSKAAVGVLEDIIEEHGERSDDFVVDQGQVILKGKDKKLQELYSSLKTASGEDKDSILAKIKSVREDDSQELFDINTGNLIKYNELPEDSKELYKKIVDKAEEKASTTELGQLKKELTNSYSNLVGISKRISSFVGENGEDEIIKQSQTTPGYLVSAVKDFFGSEETTYGDLSRVQEIASTGVLPENISKISGEHPLVNAYNTALEDYAILNRAVQTNTDPILEKQEGFWGSIGVALAEKVDMTGGEPMPKIKANANQVFIGQLEKAGLKGINQDEIDEALTQNWKSVVGGGAVDLTAFVAELYVAKGAGLNKVTKGIGALEKMALASKAAKSSKILTRATKTISSGFKETALFSGLEAGKTSLGLSQQSTREQEWATAKFGFALGVGNSFGSALLRATPAKTIFSPVMAQLSKSDVLKDVGSRFVNANAGAFSFEFASALEALQNPEGGGYGPEGKKGYFEQNPEDYFLHYTGEVAKMGLLGSKSIFHKNGMYRAAQRDMRLLNFNPMYVNSAAKRTGINPESVRKPGEETINEIDASRAEKIENISSKLETQQVTKEQAKEQIDATNKDHNILEAEAELNLAKERFDAEDKSALKPTDESVRILIQKMKKGDKFNEKDNNALVNTPLPIIYARMGVDSSTKTLNNRWNREFAIEDIMNNNTDFKAPYGSKERSDSYKFLDEMFEVGGRRQVLLKTKDRNEGQEKELQQLEKDFKNYEQGGYKYNKLQDKLDELYLKQRLANKAQAEDVLSATQEGESVSIRSAEDFQDKYNSIRKDGEDVKLADGFYDPQNKTFYINEEVVKSTRNVTVDKHEVGHFVLRDSLKDKNGEVTDEGIKVIDKVLSELTPKQRQTVQKRIDKFYRYDKEGKEKPAKDYYEEYITVLSDAITEKQIVFKENVGNALEKFVPFLRKKMPELELNSGTGKNLFELIKSYSKGEEAGIEAAKKMSISAEGKDTSGQDKTSLSLNVKQDLKWKQTDDAIETNFKVGKRDFKMTLEETAFMEFDEGKTYQDIEDIAKELGISEDKDGDGIESSERFFHYEFGDTKLGKDITGTGNALEVFSVAGNGLVDYLNKKKKIEGVIFTAKEPSRIRLYKTLGQALADKIGGSFAYKNNTFIISRKPPKAVEKDTKVKFSASNSVSDLNNELKRLIDTEYEFDDPGEFDAQVSNLKFKIKQAEKIESKALIKVKKEVRTDNLGPNDPRSKEIMETYNEGMVDVKRTKYTAKDRLPKSVENKLVPLFKGYVNTLVNQKFKQTQEEGFSKEDAVKVLEANVLNALRTFNPAVNKDLAGYVKKYGVQARQSDMFKDVNKEFTDDISAASKLAVDNSSSRSNEDVKLIKATRILNPEQLTRAKKIVLDSKIDPKSLSYKKLKGLTSELTSEITGVPAGKINNPAKNLSQGETTTAAMFIIKNVDYIRNTLPEGAVLEGASEELIGTSTGVPQKMLDAFYVRGKRGDNLSPFILRKGLTSNEILEEVGRPKGGKLAPIDPRSPRGSVIKGIIDVVDRNITNELVRTEKYLLPIRDLTQQQKIDTGAGRGAVVFSKGQEQLNNIVESIGFEGKLNNQQREEALIKSFSKHLPIAQFFRGTNFSGGNKPSTAFKRNFNFITDTNKIESKELQDEARKLIDEGLLIDLQEVINLAREGELELSLEQKKDFINATRAKKGKDWKKNTGLKESHDKGVSATIDAELAIAQESKEAFAMLREFIYHPSLNSNTNRNQANATGVMIVDGKEVEHGKGVATDEHVWNAIEHAKAKLQIYANIRNNKKGAEESLKFYKKWIKENYIQFTLYNKTDIVKGNLSDAEGNMWKDAGGTSHPLLIKNIYLAIESGKKEDWDKVPDSIIRYFNEFVSLNPNHLFISGKQVSETYNVSVDKKLWNNLEVSKAQSDLIFKIQQTKAGVLSGEDAMTLPKAKAAIEEFVKLAPGKVLASKSNNNSLPVSIKYSKGITVQEGIDALAKTDKALDNARRLNAPVKKIRVFDFDDTLAQTKSNVLYTMPDGTKGKIDAATFAREAGNMEAEGAIWDFSEFSKVMQGTKGPLLEVAKIIADKKGTDDVFVLTARPADAAGPIKEFLASMGLNIPLKNITGLGDGAPQAKAGWIMGKAAEGYNDFYFADDHTGNVKAVKDVLSVLDVKSKVQLAKVKFSKNIDEDFNKIIENKTGIAAEKRYARVKAEVIGASKGRFDWFIPPSAEDFVGLLYKTLGKGSVGDSQMAWYKEHLLNPYARGVENITIDGNALGRNFKALKKELKIVPKDLKKKIAGSPFTKEQATRVYIWDQIGQSVPGLSKADTKELVDVVKADPALELFAQQVMKLNKGRSYISPKDSWTTGTITTDLIDALNTTGRKEYLGQWQQNADVIFSEKNMNKLEAAYGKSYRVAMENILKRMKTGRNKTFGGDTLTGRFTDWINASTAGVMFFNSRSAVLQTLSSINFVNFSDNNVLAAGKAFANQPQYWKDFSKLFNSEFLTERRDGLKININESDVAEIAKQSGVKGVVNKLLKLGFLPTQVADSFAIASGGSTFYRNRIKSLVKGGMDIVAAEKQAMRDFREVAEESQQSSRPDKISQQQAGELGRIVLAFANTPAQYARLMKKATSDLKNGRGDAKTNISKIMYYGLAQNILFNSLQQALFAMSFGEDADDEAIENKSIKIANGMVDSVARGTGLAGAAFTVVKNAGIKIYKQAQKKSPRYEDVALELLKISPPISSKVQKLRSAGRTASWNMKDIKSKGFSLDNPAYLATGNVVSAAFNVPLDRVLKKVENLKNASDSEIEAYKRIALALGWSDWELGIDSKKNKEVKKKTVRTGLTAKGSLTK